MYIMGLSSYQFHCDTNIEQLQIKKINVERNDVDFIHLEILWHKHHIVTGNDVDSTPIEILWHKASHQMCGAYTRQCFPSFFFETMISLIGPTPKYSTSLQ